MVVRSGTRSGVADPKTPAEYLSEEPFYLSAKIAQP
jgi:hypothetical protein